MPAGLFTGLTFKVADDAERTEALALRRSVYERDWPHIPLPLVIDDADETAYHLIACDERHRPIAALRIVPAERRPFDMERFISLGPDVIAADRRPAEIGRLCVSHEARQVRVGSFVHLGMLKLAVELAPQLQITDYLLTAIPVLRNLYRMGQFTDVGVTFDHSTWGLVHVMRLDLVRLAGLDGDATGSVARFLRAEKPPNFIL